MIEYSIFTSPQSKAPHYGSTFFASCAILETGAANSGQALLEAINMTPHMKHVVRAVEILLPRIEGASRVTRGYVEPISKMEGIPLSAFRQARRDIRVEHQTALDGKKYRVMVLRKRPEYKGLADGYLMKGVEPWLFGPAS